MAVIAVEEGLRRVVNNKQLFFRLLNNFSGRNMADQIITAVQSGDFEGAAAACHGLKGAAANLAMHPLADIVGKIEERLRAGESPDDLFPILHESLDAVEAAITEIVSS